MPVYCFKCKECGRTEEVVRTSEDRDKELSCNDCATLMKRDWRAQFVGFRPTPGNWPMLSDAMGVNVDQIPAALEANRRAGSTVTYDHEGRAILESPGQRKHHAKLMGLHDNNAGYSDPY